MDDTVRSLRRALVEALAGEHGLRRQAVQARHEAERWHQRAQLAESRGLPDLAEQARQRAATHEAASQRLIHRAGEVGFQADRLGSALAAAAGLERGPPLPRSLEDQLTELEIEHELDQIRQARDARASTREGDV
jgi:hypothetical protein